MNDFWQTVLTFSQTLTEKIGTSLLRDFGKVKATQKSDGSLVTKADRWADEEIRRAIAETFPEHGVLSEETIHILPENDWCWVIDPIDGTTNFTHGLPIWGISLGLLYKGTPVFGAVRFPKINQFFHGYWYGNSGLQGPTGAFLNGEPIHTSSEEPGGGRLFNLCARSTAIAANPFPCKFRLLGVATYNTLLVACGAALGGVEATPKIWDIAAVWAIVQGAGGVWVALEPEPVFPLQPGEHYGSRPFPSLVASRSELVPIFKPLVQCIAK
ncbi:inositol monophosphatase family protein [Lusitaniella coriacea LEGE 07157]|uniref:inositol-phosphate phosphatase n=1 Tax=Lusitaniella coriacea LEGE 07157 TaxID=945747 RepID=A0A8J7DVF4_9CYAN|nr:inositol monophosphatase family protein [Lusitaniella coriacea]MBE9115737.1 inositol monophosphatase family protein [Lusitaniella coriacea LEGE 07157]